LRSAPGLNPDLPDFFVHAGNTLTVLLWSFSALSLLTRHGRFYLSNDYFVMNQAFLHVRPCWRALL